MNAEAPHVPVLYQLLHVAMNYLQRQRRQHYQAAINMPVTIKSQVICEQTSNLAVAQVICQ